MDGDDPQAPVRQLARDVAHEINNVLTAILGLAERLEGEPGLEASVREQVQSIAGHGRRLRRFSQQLGAFARGEAEAPAKGSGAEPIPRSAAAGAVQPAPRSAKQQRILVVDDEEVVRKILSWQLQGMGYDVVDADSVDSALRIFDAEPQAIDLALLDLVLGGRDGLDLARELRARRASLPVIMLTGIDAPPDAGRDAWLLKPVPLQDLRAAVEHALASSSS